MAKYKNYNYSQQILIPVSLEEQILPGTLEFAIHTLIETGMDMVKITLKARPWLRTAIITVQII